TEKQQLSHLLSVRDYSRINWRHHTEKIHELTEERFELLNNNDLLALLNQKKDEVDEAIKSINDRQNGSAD
ncbi:MAG: hypothetical protein J7502_17365, partial [Flavisolibacter sp.]|nr:hypothetical protein [Flavisolibacter sp.]